jgi:hypothetical protein
MQQGGERGNSQWRESGLEAIENRKAMPRRPKAYTPWCRNLPSLMLDRARV